ncbi:hypothetical protein CWB99_04410 [Pseudoalteromonas rubra]|uniref:Uncharacterized protein n=1 Tax=Pseudoalteromonas rubra TaxID=43658 RepID=A0A5S3WRD2_9GAMM|nr:hypothetical protein [Pseudoalteromonas rubra]TMP31500.1 hypothetical protein CWB99_04410 [Pseudoalteromonas rubra]TMP34584.1 hypothetical protein CWC00_07315 [Pseudoalteromonas rubra]
MNFKGLFCCVVFFSPLLNAFEQAYAPIRAGKIITVIPIELMPENIVRLSTKRTGDASQLAWTPVSDADYYVVEYYQDGQWRTVNDKVLTPFTSTAQSGPFRIKSCHRYGCSQWQQNAVTIDADLEVQAFYASNSQVESGEVFQLHWSLSGATAISVTKSVDQYTTPALTMKSPSLRSLSQSTNHVTKYKLTAYGFGGQSIQRELVVSPLAEARIIEQALPSSYPQPLRELGLDVIERTIIEHNGSLYFATHDERLFKYKSQVIHLEHGERDITWQKEWELNTAGVVANAPVFNDGFAYFTVSMMGEKGKACKVDINNSDVRCSRQFNSNTIAAPVLVNKTLLNSAASSFGKSSLFSSAPEPNAVLTSGLYIFQRDGTIKVLDTKDLTSELKTYTMPSQVKNVITTPLLVGSVELVHAAQQSSRFAQKVEEVMNSSVSEPQLIYREGNRLLGITFPKNAPQSASATELMSRMLGLETPQPASQDSESMQVVWEAEL